LVVSTESLLTLQSFRERLIQMSRLQKLILVLLLPLSAAAQSNPVVKSLNKIQFADQFAGADACIQIQNAIAALPVNGGEVDARGFLGFLNCSVNPFGNIQMHPGESVHLYLAAGATFTTSAQWVIPLGSVVTGGGSTPGGGRGTTLIASSAFPINTPIVYLGDFSAAEGALIENITIDCNHIAGSIGIFSDRVQELGGVRNVSVINYRTTGIVMIDQFDLSHSGGSPENFILDELQLGGDAGSNCIKVRVGVGGQRGGGRVTCSSSLVETFSLVCSSGVVTATFIPPAGTSAINTIPNGASIGVESGPNISLDGLYTVTSSSKTQLQWSQPGCIGTSSAVVVGVMAQNGLELDGSDGVYSQIHCEFTVDCVLVDSDPLRDGWVTRALTVSGVTGQSSVKNIVHVGHATHLEDIVLTALQRCIGPNPATQQCATNVLQDDFNSSTLRDASLAWYLIGHSSSGKAPALLSSSPTIDWLLPAPFLIFRNSSVFSQLGGQSNGSFTYCSDCTVAAPSSCSTANPSACVCSGGGTGAFAKRLNGAWLCN
jgi:hypothetical protein